MNSSQSVHSLSCNIVDNKRLLMIKELYQLFQTAVSVVAFDVRKQSFLRKRERYAKSAKIILGT